MAFRFASDPHLQSRINKSPAVSPPAIRNNRPIDYRLAADTQSIA
jgi:hypothetical protein